MQSALHPRVSYAEYLRVEATSEVRHEWFDGQILAMAGGTPEHAYLAGAAVAELRSGLRGRPCRAFSSELRVRSPATGLATYADAAVVCGPLETHPEDRNAAVNPVVLVEVLSPTTEAYDRGEKFEHYQRFLSLRDYVLVSTGRDHIDHYSRNDDGSFTRRGYGRGETVELRGVPVRLSVDAIYEGVQALRELP